MDLLEYIEYLKQQNKLDTRPFVLEPRDSESACINGLERYVKGSPYNIGFIKGRVTTFPKFSLDLHDEDITELAEMGLYWVHNGIKMGRIACVGCDFVLDHWYKAQQLINRHWYKSNCSTTWYSCALMGSIELDYNVEVDIVYDPVADKYSDPFEKPVDPTRFVCDPRDYHLMDRTPYHNKKTLNNRFSPENPDRNIGRTAGRYNSYPRHSIDYVDDIDQLVRSGFFWYQDHNDKCPKGILTCMHCNAKITDWQPGMNADQEHRKRNPSCEYLFHRDAGCDMDVEIYMDWKHCVIQRPWRCIQPHTDLPTFTKNMNL